MTIVPATIEALETLRRDPGAFAFALPHGWPEFGEGIEYTIDKLRERPDQAGWWLHFFVDAEGRLVGSGGFVGPPDDGVVEIGYEIAPGHRGRGLATAAARALIDKAFDDGDAHTVIAHTLADDNPSASVLKRLGFGCLGQIPDEEEGTVWRWELAPDC